MDKNEEMDRNKEKFIESLQGKSDFNYYEFYKWTSENGIVDVNVADDIIIELVNDGVIKEHKPNSKWFTVIRKDEN